MPELPAMTPDGTAARHAPAGSASRGTTSRLTAQTGFLGQLVAAIPGTAPGRGCSAMPAPSGTKPHGCRLHAWLKYTAPRGGCHHGGCAPPKPHGSAAHAPPQNWLVFFAPPPPSKPSWLPAALPPVNATVRLRSADTTYGSCHTLPTTLDYGNCHTPHTRNHSHASRLLLPCLD